MQLFTEDIAGYAKIAVERGVDRYPDGLTYAVPTELRDLQRGERVVVPLGRGDAATAGYIIEIAEDIETTVIDPDRIKPIRSRDRFASRLPGDLIDLAQWISSYYCCPIGITLASMLPASVKKNIGTVRHRMINLGAPKPLDEKLPPKQRDVLEHLAGLDAAARPVEIKQLATDAGLKTIGPIKRLIERGLVEVKSQTSVEAVWADRASDPFVPEQLSPAQAKIIDAIGATLDDGFATHLLFGVTGSGKTEIYIRLIQRVVDAGKVALLLVPEIALTPQTGGRLIGRFREHRVAVLHSGLTAAQRHQQWDMVMRGEANIVLGARSAVFAPIDTDKLGMIIVDEEHDGSYKQDQQPRYHGRDVAVKRGHLSDCPVILGSATPSLESWHNATERGVYKLHELPERITGQPLPHVAIVDFLEEKKAREDRRVHLLGPRLEAAIRHTLQRGKQMLLFLNRRGYANYIACADQNCDWLMTCDFCDVTMVYHQRKALPTGGYVMCHHCQSEQRLPSVCPKCGKSIVRFGLGTQRVEEELQRKFSELVDGETMLRVDSDTMQTARHFHDVLGRFGRGELKLLVGTQMITKGLDFPDVELVGVVNADTSINMPDFRANERTFQLVNQVAGRSGRGNTPGRVIVQTFQPNAPAIQLAAQHDYVGFAKYELDERRKFKLPPWTRMVRFVVRDEDHVKCVTEANELARNLRAMIEQEKRQQQMRLLGPMPCPIARIAGKHRQQVEILADSAAHLQQLLAAARSKGVIKPGASLAVDVDPVSLL